MVSPQIPKPLLECRDAPDVPAEGDSTQKDVAKYLVELYNAYDDCQGNLQSVKRLLNEFEAQNKKPE